MLNSSKSFFSLATSCVSVSPSPVYGTKSSYVAFRFSVSIGLNVKFVTVVPFNTMIATAYLLDVDKSLNVTPLPISFLFSSALYGRKAK